MTDWATLFSLWSRLEALGAIVHRGHLAEDCLGPAIAAARQRLRVLESGESDGCHTDIYPASD